MDPDRVQAPVALCAGRGGRELAGRWGGRFLPKVGLTRFRRLRRQSLTFRTLKSLLPSSWMPGESFTWENTPFE